MGAVVAAEAEALFGGRPGVAVGLIAMAGVAGTVLSLYGLERLLRAEELRPYRFLAVTFLVLYVFFVAVAGRPYYLGGLYGPLAAAGALGLQRRREAGRHRWRWVAWPAYTLSAAAAAGMLVVSVTYAQSGVGAGIAQRTAAAYHALPPAQQERTVIMGQSYITAAYIDGYSLRHGTPPAYSSNRSYGYFPPPPESKAAVLYYGTSPDELRPHFADIRKINAGVTVTGPSGGPGKDMSLWLATGKREPWASLWPRLRHLGVS